VLKEPKVKRAMPEPMVPRDRPVTVFPMAHANPIISIGTQALESGSLEVIR
jgi:hypothetical protein